MIRIVKLSFKEDYVEDFRALFEERKLLIRTCDGCTQLELWQDEDTPSTFITYSIWDNAAALETYRQSDLFKETWSIIKPWFDQKPEAFSAQNLVSL